MEDYYKEMQRRMESERDDEILDYQIEHERKIGIQSIDMELEHYYSDLSAEELAELRFNMIRELDMELVKRRREMEIEMTYERHIEEMNEDMEEARREMRDSMFEDDDYPY